MFEVTTMYLRLRNEEEIFIESAKGVVRVCADKFGLLKVKDWKIKK